MIRMGLVGLGKIARDEHLPAIAAHPGAELRAVVSKSAKADSFAVYSDLESMLSVESNLDAIILCQPPQARFEAARMSLAAGKHVFLEKPPGATLSEVDMLRDLAAAQGVTLFASWHSRWSQPVAAAKAWCAQRTLTRVSVEWKEDVRRWHPGQDWIWQAGGFGVFDPGINALSILTEVLPEPVRLIDAALEIPSNRHAPIAAELSFESQSGIPISAAFDWRQTGPQIWRIMFEAGEDRHIIAQAGDDAASAETGAESALAAEYRAMYAHFVQLVLDERCDVDLAPLRLVADAYVIGRITLTDPYFD